MTTLDVHADQIRTQAANVELPKPSTILVTLIGLLPFLVGWVANAVKQFAVLLIVSFRHGWNTAERQMGAPRSRGGGG